MTAHEMSAGGATVTASPSPSPFFDSTKTSKAGDLAILHLRRDQLVPIVLSDAPSTDYPEGAVTNTRFGSFPHKTLIGQTWGAQVLASKVDTGGRGRKSLKRKRACRGDGADARDGNDDEHGDHEHDHDGRPDIDPERGIRAPAEPVVAAQTGFAHLLPPTPETWTLSLPHRTQVVYTPDASYILQRLRVRPGQTVIEAGAGSGSFTHAAARAVFDGAGRGHGDDGGGDADGHGGDTRRPGSRYGRVCSFEYHASRAQGLRTELKNHRLEDIVRVTHRDVYTDGFWLPDAAGNGGRDEGADAETSTHVTAATAAESTDTNTAAVPDPTESLNRTSPNANAIFLDLPAPWLALPHLVRKPSNPKTGPSPLDPTGPVHICTFSPCVEQVTSTVETMRSLGYAEIEMVEVLHRRVDVRREAVGTSVDDAITRLRELEARTTAKTESTTTATTTATPDTSTVVDKADANADGNQNEIKTSRTRVMHRTEPDWKAHSSYLVFAVIPQLWTPADEAACAAKWGPGPRLAAEELSRGPSDRGSKKEARKRLHAAKMGKKNVSRD